MTKSVRGLALTVFAAAPLAAQGPPPIMDNSFLIEEAYNQEWGVVQHISLFARGKGGSWSYAFTQEWPLRGQRHQLSYTVPLLRSAGATGPGDLALNYRLQLLGSGEGRAWIALRFSLLLPTGRWQAGRGEGVLGGQVSLPLSLKLSDRFSAHLNASLSLHPSARAANGDRATLASYAAGASLIYYMTGSINLMVEGVAEASPEVTGPGLTARETSVFISPGIRWAHNFASGLQIVPGIAYARGLGDAGEESRLLVYLSFEHSFKRRAP